MEQQIAKLRSEFEVRSVTFRKLIIKSWSSGRSGALAGLFATVSHALFLAEALIDCVEEQAGIYDSAEFIANLLEAAGETAEKLPPSRTEEYISRFNNALTGLDENLKTIAKLL